jgi:hypothetical protein
MKFKILLFIALLQQPFDITEHIVDMQDGWSIGNGCNEPYTNWITTSSIETNGNTLEIMNAWLEVQGKIAEYGFDQELIKMITDGKIILSCEDSMISISTTLSTEEQDLQVTKVFPNPFGSQITIKGLDIKEFLIYDMSGKAIIKKQTKLNTNVIQLDYLSSGIYFLQVNFNSREPSVIRIIKS